MLAAMNRAARRQLERSLSKPVKTELARRIAHGTHVAQSVKAHGKIERAAFTCEIKLNADGSAPEWVPMFPTAGADGVLPIRDGREFKLSDQAAFVERFNEDGHPVPFDTEHASEIKGPKGEPAPAIGWIVELADRGDEGVWARVEWNPTGAGYITRKEYRYNSPGFTVDDDTGEIMQLVSAGLTNRPAFIMPAIARSERAEEIPTMDLAALLKLLGLPDTATADDATAKIKQLVEAASSEDAAAKEEIAVVEAAHAKTKTELASALAGKVDIAAFVPRSDFDAQVARVNDLVAKQKSDEQTSHKKVAIAAVERAIEAGKITPPNKDFYVDTCSTLEGLAKFDKLVESMPVIAAPSKIDGKPLPVAGAQVTTASELEVAKRCGVSAEAYELSKKTLATATVQ